MPAMNEGHESLWDDTTKLAQIPHLGMRLAREALKEALTTYFCVVYKFSLLASSLQYYYDIYLQTHTYRGKGQPTFVCKLC